MITVDADLRIDAAGSRARLVASGQRITLTADEPQKLWLSLREADLPGSIHGLAGVRAVGRVADALEAAGVEFHLVGPQGEIARLGSGTHSRWARFLLGSNQIHLGTFRSLRPLLTAAFRGSRLNPRRRTR